MTQSEHVVQTYTSAGIFEGTPVTFFMCFITVGFSLALGGDRAIVQGLSMKGLQVEGLYNLLPALFVLQNAGEMFFGVVLLFSFRNLERVVGSTKFAMRTVMGLLFQCVFSILLSGDVATGPYGVIFALLVIYCFTIPSTASFDLVGFNMTNKVFLILSALQMLFQQGLKSLSVGSMSALLGLFIYILGHNLEIPNFLCVLCSKTLGRLLEGQNAEKPKLRFGRYVQEQRHFQNSRNPSQANRQPNARNALPEASSNAVEQLVSMGFDRFLASEALVATNNNLNEAMNLLLSQT